jgi:threonine/homoserine/homoserine lactone efflux protein
MDGTTDPLLFLAMVAFISLSGAIMPGPLFATTVAKGYQDPQAGLKISAGHAVIEIPLIIAIFFGLEVVLRERSVIAVIGIVGGAFLLYMGLSMFRQKVDGEQVQGSRLGPFTAGIALTAMNPYFLLWWATVGASLIGLTSGYGLIMLPAFAAVHLACDLGWHQFISFSVHRSRHVLTGRGYRILFSGCGAVLVFFALYFMASSIGGLFA